MPAQLLPAWVRLLRRPVLRRVPQHLPRLGQVPELTRVVRDAVDHRPAQVIGVKAAGAELVAVPPAQCAVMWEDRGNVECFSTGNDDALRPNRKPCSYDARVALGEQDAALKDDRGCNPPLAPHSIIVDPRKFSHYVLDPDNAEGKDRIFLDWLGYRPRSVEDARTLAGIYPEQARISMGRGTYDTSRQDEHGRRYVIPINLSDIQIRSVWILRPDSVLSLVTPFSGFVRRPRRGGPHD